MCAIADDDKPYVVQRRRHWFSKLAMYNSTARPGVSIYWLGYVENWLGWADLSIP